MYLVFDIGGTKTRIASSTDLMTLSEPVIFETSSSYEEGVKLLGQKIQEVSLGHTLKAVAGGITGPLNHDKSESLISPNLPDWSQKPVKQDLQELLGVPIYLENDAALAGTGESSFGAALKYPTASIVAYITVSTGVGGARITNKRVDPSSLGFEPGHQIIVPDGEKCGCGGFGHLESYIGGSSIERKYGRKAESIEDIEIWTEICTFLAIGLNNTVVHWSPDLIILGGGIGVNLRLDLVEMLLKKYLTIFKTTPKIEHATLGDLGGLYGALVLLHKS